MIVILLRRIGTPMSNTSPTGNGSSQCRRSRALPRAGCPIE